MPEALLRSQLAPVKDQRGATPRPSLIVEGEANDNVQLLDSPLLRNGSILQTAFGPLTRLEVYGQVLIVPVCVAFFGIAIAIIIATVM